MVVPLPPLSFSSGPSAALAEQDNDPFFNDRTLINIAPVGVNLGEILRALDGPAANGGIGLGVRSPIEASGTVQAAGFTTTLTGSAGASTLIIIGLGVVVAVFMFGGRR